MVRCCPFYHIAIGELAQTLTCNSQCRYFVPKALNIPFKAKPAEGMKFVNYYRASSQSMPEKEHMARWIINQIDKRKDSPMTAFQPPYASDLFADPFA